MRIIDITRIFRICDRLGHQMATDTVLVACETLKKELETVMARGGHTTPVVWIESGLHAWPDKLRDKLQETIDGLPPQYTTVLFAFGFCGNSMVGISAGGRTLVLPRVADCIPIFLGSQEKRQAMGSDVYFLTEGYMAGEQNIIKEHDYYLQRYGEKRADRIARSMLAHYNKFSVIDTGAFAVPPVVAQIRPHADRLGIPVDVVDGDLVILEDLLAGGRDPTRFLRVPPGGTVSFEDSLDIGQSQILPGQ